jgi:hypothetical protein
MELVLKSLLSPPPIFRLQKLLMDMKTEFAKNAQTIVMSALTKTIAPNALRLDQKHFYSIKCTNAYQFLSAKSMKARLFLINTSAKIAT